MMKKITASLPFRIGFAIGLLCLLLLGSYFLYRYRSPFWCPVYRFTHLYCPGCGSGRAAYSLLHLRPLTALGYNPFFVLFLPFVAYYLLKQYLKILLARDVLPFFQVTHRGSLVVLVVILLFTLLRNLPFFPFSLLAP